MHWIAAAYRRRIVNINVNIIVAGLIAMGLTLIPVHLTHHFTDNHIAIMVVTVGADLVFDVAAYYTLHWLANHWPHRRGMPASAPATIAFFKDATLVQFERALLAPLLYAVFLGLQFFLLRRGIGREWTVVIALGTGVLTTRVLHTLWMIRDARRRAPVPATPPSESR